MTGGTFCILALPLVRPRNGPLSNSERPFPGRRPRYLLCDRDRIFGADFVKQVKAIGIKPVLSAPWWPWQRAYVERVIGTIRRECLDHVIVFSEADLSRHLRKFADYYHQSRTHLRLQKDTPESRPVQAPEAGRIVAIPELGGLHHRYERRAA
jgi:putative transposase